MNAVRPAFSIIENFILPQRLRPTKIHPSWWLHFRQIAFRSLSRRHIYILKGQRKGPPLYAVLINAFRKGGLSQVLPWSNSKFFQGWLGSPWVVRSLLTLGRVGWIKSFVLRVCSIYGPRLRPSGEGGSEEPELNLGQEKIFVIIFMDEPCKSSVANSRVEVNTELHFIFQFWNWQSHFKHSREESDGCLSNTGITLVFFLYF